MIPNWWTPKASFSPRRCFVACVAAGVAIGLAYPEPVSNAALGPDWQCSRVAYVWTTCSRLTHAQSASVRLAGETAACKRPRS